MQSVLQSQANRLAIRIHEFNSGKEGDTDLFFLHGKLDGLSEALWLVYGQRHKETESLTRAAVILHCKPVSQPELLLA